MKVKTVRVFLKGGDAVRHVDVRGTHWSMGVDGHVDVIDGTKLSMQDSRAGCVATFAAAVFSHAVFAPDAPDAPVEEYPQL